jgi:hypothetical protein
MANVHKKKYIFLNTGKAKGKVNLKTSHED